MERPASAVSAFLAGLSVEHFAMPTVMQNPARGKYRANLTPLPHFQWAAEHHRTTPKTALRRWSVNRRLEVTGVYVEVR